MQPWNSQIAGQIITQQLLDCVIEAGRLAQAIRTSGLSSEEKTGKDDLVTTADTALSEFFEQHLHALFPEIQIIDEEANHQPQTQYQKLTAIIDPIDGTTNFFNQLPHWGVSVGFVKDNLPLAGIVYLPDVNKCFYGETNCGVFCNAEPVGLTQHATCEAASVVFEQTYAFDKVEHELTDRVINQLEPVLKIKSLHAVGSQVFSLMKLFEGQGDFFFHFKTKPWDVAAAIALVQEAGGKVYTAFGDPYHLFDESIMITNGRIDTQEFVELVQSVKYPTPA